LEAAFGSLAARIGWQHVRRHLGMEQDAELRAGRRDKGFFHADSWYSLRGLVRGGLRSAGLLARARRNARRIETCLHDLALPLLPPACHGFTVLKDRAAQVTTEATAAQLRRLTEVMAARRSLSR
jgi:hypothetical protein